MKNEYDKLSIGIIIGSIGRNRRNKLEKRRHNLPNNDQLISLTLE